MAFTPRGFFAARARKRETQQKTLRKGSEGLQIELIGRVTNTNEVSVEASLLDWLGTEGGA